MMGTIFTQFQSAIFTMIATTTLTTLHTAKEYLLFLQLLNYQLPPIDFKFMALFHLNHPDPFLIHHHNYHHHHHRLIDSFHYDSYVSQILVFF